jgi:hypothetical protein
MPKQNLTLLEKRRDGRFVFRQKCYRICEHKEKKTPRSVRARQQFSDGNKAFTIPSDNGDRVMLHWQVVSATALGTTDGPLLVMWAPWRGAAHLRRGPVASSARPA